MALLYPLLIVAAAVAMWRRRGAGTGGKGSRWFGAWALSGALMTFSFLTGFSIGLLVLPVAAVVLIWTARRAPSPREALGFVAGAGLVAGVLSPLAGTVAIAVAVVAYYTSSRGDEELTPTP